jgi:hypothetical protein
MFAQRCGFGRTGRLAPLAMASLQYTSKSSNSKPPWTSAFAGKQGPTKRHGD